MLHLPQTEYSLIFEPSEQAEAWSLERQPQEAFKVISLRKLCGPLCLCGENILESIYHRGTENHRECAEKNFDRFVALLIPPVRLSLFHERVHAFTRVFSLH